MVLMEEEQQTLPWMDIVGRVALTTVGHPLELVKVLIQLGHEPLPPKQSYTLFGRPALLLPGPLTYMKHIRRTDGFMGLFRGLRPRMASNIISGATYTALLDRLPTFEENAQDEDAEESETTQTPEQKILCFLRKTVRETVARCAAIIASHPFHLITVRTMAQFIGREEQYKGVTCSVVKIYKEEGVAGFFSGLVPRMLGEIFTLWLAGSVTFVINTYLVDDKTMKTYLSACIMFMASAVTYPFTLVGNCMAVNGSGLQAGSLPYMPLYDNWTDCWSHLRSQGQLKRGSTILWRYYHGPYILDKSGRPAIISPSSFRQPGRF